MLTEKLKRYGSFGTHDAIKLVGLLLMAVDHVGVFAFPHSNEWRIIGRAAAPIFFFLISYSPSYRFHLDIVCAALLLVAIKFIGMHSLAYPNILVSLIIARLLLEQVEKKRLSLKYPWLAFLLLTLLWPFSWDWFEYGTLGLMFSLCGYLQKHTDRYSLRSRLLMLISSFALYGLTTCAVTIPHPGIAGSLLLAIMLAGCGALLWHYHPRRLQLPERWQSFESVLAWPARYSLWIYTLHLAILHLVTGVYF